MPSPADDLRPVAAGAVASRCVAAGAPNRAPGEPQTPPERASSADDAQSDERVGA